MFNPNASGGNPFVPDPHFEERVAKAMDTVAAASDETFAERLWCAIVADIVRAGNGPEFAAEAADSLVAAWRLRKVSKEKPSFGPPKAG